MSFREYMESDIDLLISIMEDAGNLKGLPKLFIKEIVSGFSGGYGGKNSTLKLYKANAKQKDVTAAAKLCGGFVKPEDKGYHRLSQAEIEATANKNGHAGVVIKIDGLWSYMVLYDDYGDSGGHYKLIGLDGPEKIGTMKTSYRAMRKRGSHTYKVYRQYLKATEISDYIDFKDDKVDVYLVTTDLERLKKRQEREQERAIPKISSTTKKALVKFLDSKSSGLISKVDEELQKNIEEFSKQAKLVISDACQGKERNININKMLDNLKQKFETINSLAYSIRNVIDDGTIKDRWASDKSWAYRKFKELVKEIEDKGII